MTANIIQTPEAQKKIVGKLQEISDSFVRIAAERDLIKQTVEDISEEFQIDKKFVNKMARTYHKDSFAKEVTEKTEFEIIYETITGQKAEPEVNHPEQD
jgi:hypothetical protein